MEERRQQEAEERRRRREATRARGEQRRSATEKRREERRSQGADGDNNTRGGRGGDRGRGGGGGRRSSGRSSGGGGDADGVAELKRAAAKRVETWGHGKDFFGLMRTLNEFDGLDLTKGVGTSRGLAPGASAAQLKKAFHRASLALHPDRLVGLSEGQRAEAEEIFKTLSSSYDEARKAAEAELTA